jgi:hypothetical protein
MEHLPPRSPDEEPHGPEHDRLDPGEIDLTGATRQDDNLADVIGDAIGEAESGSGEVPDWGARTLARALANERDDPLSGALHHFAVTGRTDPEAIARELADLYQATTDEQIREWINWLGTYVMRLPDEPAPTHRAGEPGETAPDLAAAPEAFGTHLRHAFAEADVRGEAITAETTRDLARLLAIFLDADSEMARFADTGDANPVLLSQECQAVRRFTEHVPGASEWITRFEQHLASRSDLGRHTESPSPPTRSTQAVNVPERPVVAQGIREHGAAFEAFLTLPDVDPDQNDLLQSFNGCYVGAYDSMDAAVRDLTEGVISEDEQARWAAEGVTLQDLVKAAWDIVELGSTFYVFSQ